MRTAATPGTSGRALARSSSCRTAFDRRTSPVRRAGLTAYRAVRKAAAVLQPGQTAAVIGVVSVIASSDLAVTIGLALLFMQKRLAPWQWGGIGALFAGVGLTSAS